MGSIRMHGGPVGRSSPTDGEWLSEEGPYLDLIKKLCVSDPSLRRPDQKNRSLKNPLHPGSARVVCLQLGPHATQRDDFEGIEGAARLREHLKHAPRSGRNTLCIMEGLAKDYISIMGSHLSVPPSFFTFQDRNRIWAMFSEAVPDTAAVPSLLHRESGFRVKYYEVQYSTQRLASYIESCAKTGRHLGVTTLQSEKSEAFTVRRKCSFWYRRRPNDNGWDGILLCDPPLERTLTKGTQFDTLIRARPWQGGYSEILPPALVDCNLPGPPKLCLLDDFCYYLQHYRHTLEDVTGPHAILTFVKKIIAGHYRSLINFNRAMISQQEYSLAHREDLQGYATELVEQQWSELQALSRRCSEQLEDIEDAMLAFRIPLQDPDAAAEFAWDDCTADYQFLRMRLRGLRARAEGLINSMTAVASMTGNRQAVLEARRALKETKNAKTLALVGLIFIPLAYSASLFSMQDTYVPGSAGFWIYWAVSIPLMALVFIITVLYQLGLDQDSTWRYHVYLDRMDKVRRGSSQD